MTGWVVLGWVSVGLGMSALQAGRRSSRSSRGGPARRHRHGPDRPPGRELRLRLIAALAAVGLCWVALGSRGVLIAPVAVSAALIAVRYAMSRRQPLGSDPRKVALLIDLLAGALEAGLPVEHALIAVAAAASPDRLTDDAAAGPTGRPIDGAVRDRSADDFAEAARPFGQLGRMLSLGAEPEAAWSSLAAVPDLAVAATAGRRCAHSGARLAQALRSAAEQLREQRHARSVARAERLGIWVLLPLGLCFLPAFVCLGILPTILGVARGVGVLGIGMP